MGGFRLLTAATGLTLLATAAVTVAHATPRSAEGCTRAAAMKSLFPTARAVGFSTRSRIARTGRRHPYWSGWCGNWRTTYQGRPGRPCAFAEVLVSLYKTRDEALVALAEPGYGRSRTLPGGVRIRTFSDTYSGYVASVARNVFVSSTGCCGEPPDYPGSDAVREQTRIHRHIHAAVLRPD